MRFCVLGSGSKGNSTYVSSGDTAILIDAGLSGIEVQRRLAGIGVEISSLSAIIVTHEHTDHVRGVPVLSRRMKLPVFANPETYLAAGSSLNKLHVFNEFNTGNSFSFQNLEIHPFSISHDSADPVGFIINNGSFSLGYCTDTGVITRLMHHRLSGCHGLIVESNHDPDLLQKGPYPLFLKQRVKGNKGHLANIDTAGFIKDILNENLEHVVLAHISETNNQSSLAYETTASCLADGSITPGLSLASQDRPGDMVILGSR